MGLGIHRRNEGERPDRVGNGSDSGGDPLTTILGIKEEGPVIAHREIQAIQTLSLSSIGSSKHLDDKKGGTLDALCSGDGDRVLKNGAHGIVDSRKRNQCNFYVVTSFNGAMIPITSCMRTPMTRRRRLNSGTKGTIMFASNVLDEKPHPEAL
ncbi:hypothetical protein BHE74_00046820 [Ensete ventricosum]|nr:hypothetical protein GW17_00023478 [Ensete ventricosum]RWW47208.1 hypothetical protein BHE74_00046820 [Ensete ventricosum]RZR99870.1 hypothetical protein BHM03_00029495 [Ensete ventricosum]